MNFDFKLIDFFKLPTKIMVAICIAMGCVLFLPDNLIKKMYMFNFRNKYGFTIGLIFLVATTIVIVKIVITIYEQLRKKYFWKKFRNTAKDRLLKLDDYQKTIVYSLYIEYNHTRELLIHDGAVKYLKYTMVITETANQYMISDFNNATFPYMLNPWVVETIQKEPDIANELKKAYEEMKHACNIVNSDTY